MFRFRKKIKEVISELGYEVVKKPISAKASEYERILPLATYSPWGIDKEFLNVFNIIRNNTLVDIYRCYEIWQLVEQVSKLDGIFLEVGVWRGGTGALIAQKSKTLGLTDTIYLCDTFHGVVKAGPKDSGYKGLEHADTSVDIVEELLIKKLGLDNFKILQGIFPDESSQVVSNEKVKFCHIDVDVYESAKDIDKWIWERLVVGGIIVYDDYGFKGCTGIKNFVNEQRSLDDRIVVHNLNGHAVVIKIK